MKNYEKSLPEDYELVKTIDINNKKFAITFNVIVILVTIPMFVFIYIYEGFSNLFSFLFYFNIPFIISMVIYTIGHELVHGIAYYLLTRQKLTFGINLSAAYCGVPDIYTYRHTSLIALLAPFIFFNIVFIMIIMTTSVFWIKITAEFLLAVHLSGCSGDLYDTFLLLFIYKDKNLLIKDTGPAQYFYQKRSH